MRQETQWTTIFWEGWTALALCAAAVFWPGSAALGYPAVLWPGLALAAAVPVLWAGWWLWAEKAPPLTEEELMAKREPPDIPMWSVESVAVPRNI